MAWVRLRKIDEVGFPKLTLSGTVPLVHESRPCKPADVRAVNFVLVVRFVCQGAGVGTDCMTAAASESSCP